MEKHLFKTQDNYNIHYLKFNNDIDLRKFIIDGGILNLLLEVNQSLIGVYVENSNKQSKYLLSECLLTELTQDEYYHLYNLTYV